MSRPFCVVRCAWDDEAWDIEAWDVEDAVPYNTTVIRE